MTPAQGADHEAIEGRRASPAAELTARLGQRTLPVLVPGRRGRPDPTPKTHEDMTYGPAPVRAHRSFPHPANLRFGTLPGALLCALATTLATTLPTPAPAAAQEWPITWQEQHSFQNGPTPYEPLMAFWYELERRSPHVSIRPLTVTRLDRPLTLVTVSRDPVLDPRDALRSGKAIVLIANSVHGGETAGKEASQLIARDLVLGGLQHLLDDVIVLFIPLLNPDGGEVGRRTNEEGFDLNRDYVKLESQEIRALVTRVMNEWTPDIHVDTHHGGSVPYTLTWQGTLNPAVDAELRAYPYRHIFPRMRAALRAEDYDGFEYSGPRTVEGEDGWGSTSVEPRKHHVYAGLVNSIAILLETPANTRRLRNQGTTLEEVPDRERYFHQVRGQVLAKRAILQVAAERRGEIRDLTTGARLRAIRNGASYADEDRVILDYRLISRGDDRVWVRDDEAPLGYRAETLPIFLEYEPVRTTTRPLGYVLPPAMGRVIPTLLDHGIVIHRFTDPVDLELEVYDATAVRQDTYFQGHYLKAVAVQSTTDTVAVPAGAYYVSTAQSRGNLIAYLMEPETDDNLITWGYADHLLRITTPIADGAGAAVTGTARGERSASGQRVPMMRLVRAQALPLLEVVPYNDPDRTRYYQVW